MAHEIENMFSVKETPWHGLGTVIQDAPSIQQILELAGLNWKVELKPLYLGDGKEVTQKAIVRDTDQSVLGFVGKRYRPLQNQEALDFFKVFHNSGAASFETAGSLRGGQKIWIMARLESQEMEIVKGDTVRKYLMLSNGHDGVTGIRVGFTPVRVVCANTLAMAHNDKTSKLIRVFHSKKVVENLELLKDTINLANQSFEATAEQYRQLAKRQVNRGDLEAYVTQVFYNGKAAETDREKLARETLNREIERLFETGHGNDMAGVRGTVWALYNGVTQYLSYESGRTQDSRMDSLWFGDAKGTNETALEAALELAA
jgi:phage/plasmid-like protein (TIGR03299 family)